MKVRISVDEIASRLEVNRATVYALLQKHIIPGIRPNPRGRWIVSRQAYETWERTAGLSSVSTAILQDARVLQ